MINGAHVIIYTLDAVEDRTFLRDVIGLPFVAQGGWPIFGLPPSEVAFHPTEETGGKHELYLMCEDVEAFIAAMRAKGVEVADPDDQGWGILTSIKLPSGIQVGVYQARHERPDPMQVPGFPKKPARKKSASKKTASKKSGEKAKQDKPKKDKAGKKPKNEKKADKGKKSDAASKAKKSGKAKKSKAKKFKAKKSSSKQKAGKRKR